MKIVELRAENVKRLRAVNITPDDAVQVVAGRNAQGKTSVLDSIWMALQWKAAAKVTPRPVRDGEDKAEVRLDLGDLVVVRKWDAEGDTTLTITTPDGVPQKRPQQLLDELVGMLSFDPLEFANAAARQQVEMLLGLVELPFDPVALDAERQEIYDKRRLLHADVQRSKGAYESMGALASDGITAFDTIPDTEESTADLMREYEHAMGTIANNNKARTEQAAAVAEVDRLERALADAKDRKKRADAAVFALGDDPDLEPIRAKLATIEATNILVREAGAWRNARARYEQLQDEYEGLTEQIEALDKQKADGLAGAHFPLDGLGFDAEGVTYQGQPFSQASGAERLRVSLALAMAMNPELRVVRITDGSLLDSDNMAMIADMAAAHDFQVWVERVDESGTAGVVIEDGMVAR